MKAPRDFTRSAAIPCYAFIKEKKRMKNVKKAKRQQKNLWGCSATYMPRLNEPDGFVGSDEDARMIAERTGFTPIQVTHFYEEFEAYSKRRTKGGPLFMDAFHFGKLMSKYKVHDKRLRTDLFRLHDKDSSGRIEFDEFINILAIFQSGTRELQAKTLFQLCDVDAESYKKPLQERSIQRFELLRFVTQGITSKSSRKMINGLSTELFDRLDEDLNGNITYEEFAKKVKEDDIVWECLKELSPFTRVLNSNRRSTTDTPILSGYEP